MFLLFFKRKSIFISTSKGILTSYEAKLNRVGGEILFYIW
ncbi:MAG: 30S ribosomal protein S8 [Gammaproteobacteria bacterium]